ncbi:uncharacterized protein [Solanum lycopersicum]|uniref:uncharacterized protein n=1 Tax=Solanum lycopersicum TaxID=4081 RepID=UPI003749CFCE
MSDNGVEVNPRETEDVKNWIKPLTPTDIRRFLGLVGYYRRFMEGFSSIAASLTALTKKKAKLERKKACDKSFQELKDRLTSALGGRVIDYVSKQLKVHENNYPTHLPGVGTYGICTKIVDALLVWSAYGCVHRTQKSPVRVHTEGLESMSVEMKNIVEYVAKYPNCKHVKAEYLNPRGFTQMIEVLKWKWESINMVFVVGLSKTRRQHDSRWVIVEKMTMSANFIPEVYLQSRRSLKKSLGTQVKLSTAFHPLTDGQAERTIHTLEDMLRVPVEILDRQVKNLRNKEIATVKVLWRNHLVEGAMWEAEAEADMISRYTDLFSS